MVVAFGVPDTVMLAVVGEPGVPDTPVLYPLETGTAEPAVPIAVEPFHNVRLLNAAFVVACDELAASVTTRSVIFTFSTLLVSVKRKVEREFPVEPITIWPDGTCVESLPTWIVAAPARVKFWPGIGALGTSETALFEIMPVPVKPVNSVEGLICNKPAADEVAEDKVSA